MPRTPRTEEEKRFGHQLSVTIAEWRNGLSDLSQAHLAHDARISVDTLRKLEQSAIVDPGFQLVHRILTVLGRSMDELANAMLDGAE